MRKYSHILVFVFFTVLVINCKRNDVKQEKETFLEGETTILVDETLKPIIEDQVQIFESKYPAKINIIAKSEAEIIQSFVKDSSRLAVLTRTLTKKELHFFESKKLFPKITPFAKDAIALISNANNKDTLITLKEVLDFMKGVKTSKIKGLVFDDLNSSTVRYFKELGNIESLPVNGVFSFKSSNEVIHYVAQNDGMIGIVGINYIFEPTEISKQDIKKINVLNVQNVTDSKYYGPTQNNIAEGKYPLARDLFIVNAQGFSGLGMGFSTFVKGDVGQRIVLKSGLVPVLFPSRQIRIRKTINNDKKAN